MLYRPLEIFRSGLIREINAWILAALVWFVSLNVLRGAVTDDNNAESLAEILEEDSLADRFEAFIRQLYGPDQPFVAQLLVFLVPYAFLFAGYLAGVRYLAYLVPRSGINIGYSARRYRDYLNVFKFIVFTLFVGGVVGLITNLIAAAI